MNISFKIAHVTTAKPHAVNERTNPATTPNKNHMLFSVRCCPSNEYPAGILYGVKSAYNFILLAFAYTE